MDATPSLLTDLTICSYNIRGYNSTKIKYIHELFSKFTILIIEEHWLNSLQLCDFSDLFPSYCVHGVTAMDSTVLLQGRPKGGVLVIYPDSLGGTVKPIKTSSNRLCALSLHVDCI